MLVRLALICCTLLLSASAQVVEVCRLEPKAADWSLSCTPAPSIQKADFDAMPIRIPVAPPVKVCGEDLPAAEPAPLDLPSLAKLTTSSQFTVSPSGGDTVVVSQTPPASGASKPVTAAQLKSLNELMEWLLNHVPSTPPGFSVELTIPHAAGLPALASQVGNINGGKFTVTASGKNRVLVTTPNGLPPSCVDWKAFQEDAKELAWSMHPAEPEARVISLDASATATALGAGATPAAPGGGTTAPAPPSGGGSTGAAAPAPTPAFTITVAPPAATAKAAGKPAAGSIASTITVAAAPAPPAPAKQPAPGPAAVASVPAPGVSIGAIPGDTLVFAATNPGDDAAVVEKARIIARLNLPRSEMSISAWSIQNSSTDPRSVNESSRLVREEVAAYNGGLERMLALGWAYVKGAIADPGAHYFYEPFYNYVSRRIIYEGSAVVGTSTGIEQHASAVLNEAVAHSQRIDAQFAGSSTAHSPTLTRADYLGLCPSTEYCLGYTTLFHPLQPRIMDLLLAFIAADDPKQQMRCAVGASESGTTGCAPLAELAPPQCDGHSDAMACKVWKQLFPWGNAPKSSDSPGCETLDYEGVLQSLGTAKPVIFLNCFRQEAEVLFDKSTTYDSATYLDVTRASIADFLFNYKMSQQYPHEFVPYDLTTSAQAMNSALRPLIDAFVSDVEAYQAVLKRKLGVEIDEMNKHLTRHSLGDKPRYLENSIVTIHTIAGSEGAVDTSTESYLDQANAPTLSALSNAVLGGAASGTASGSTGVSGLLAGARLNEAQAIAAGLGQFQSSRIHLGRELAVDVRPVTLPGASSAELQVTLKADDEAGTGTYSSGGSGDAELARFSKSDTSTRIRVDSLKLFEVSSFAAQLSTPKKRFPLLPPFVELPYIGSLASLPLAPSREYHASIAVLSAVVIPTAADLAFTARFVADQLLAVDDAENASQCLWPGDEDGSTKLRYCKTRNMVSLDDFAGQPVREFNRMKTHCLATNGKSATPSLVPLTDKANEAVCAKLSFKDVIGEVH